MRAVDEVEDQLHESAVHPGGVVVQVGDGLFLLVLALDPE